MSNDGTPVYNMDWENVVVLLLMSCNAIICYAQTDTPTVEYCFREKFRGRRSTEELYFRCALKNHTDPSAVYQVHWYIDGKLTFSSSAVMSSDLNETYLTEKNGLELNKKIACAVKRTFPGNHTEYVSERSDDFFAGVQIENTIRSIRRGGDIKIRLRLTVPFGCAYYSTAPVDIQNCVLNIQMVGLSHGNCTLDGRSLSNCGLSIRRNAWNDTHEFVITHTDDDSRYFSPYRLIQLKTERLTSNEIWSGLTLPSVQVYILENHMSSSKCSKHEDGNQILLSIGMNYITHHLTQGQIVLTNEIAITTTIFSNADFQLDCSNIRNINLFVSSLPGIGKLKILCRWYNSTSVFTALNFSDVYGNIFEIQTRRAKSSGPNNRLCGLAVRAGGDVFILDACEFPVTKKFKQCIDKAISVNIWKDSSRNFTELRLLPGIRISVTEYTRNNEAFLVAYICHVGMMHVAEDILNEVSSNLFEMSRNDRDKLHALVDGSFAVCACLWERPTLYFIDYDLLNNSTTCSNRDDRVCASKITDTPPLSNLCQIGNRKFDWMFVFKAIAGNGEKVFDAWVRDLSKLSHCTPGLGCLPEGENSNILSPTSRHLTSPLIKEWNSLNIQKVKVELYLKGTLVVKLIFDGWESDYMNWFSSDRLLYSNYQDMHRNTVYNYFSIDGLFKVGGIERRFHINSVYNGCPGDIGWLTVVDSETSKRCSWETSLNRPQFLYSKERTMRNWNSGEIGKADTMAISIFR